MRRTLADVVLEAGLLDEASLRQARRHARRSNVSLCRALVEQRYLAEGALLDLVSRETSAARVDLRAEPIDDEALREVPHALAEAHCLLPLTIDRAGDQRIIRVAMADPLDADAVEEIELSTGCELVPLVGAVSEVTEAARRAYSGIITKMIPRGSPSSTQPTRATTEPDVEARLAALVDYLVDRGVVDAAALAGYVSRRRP